MGDMDLLLWTFQRKLWKERHLRAGIDAENTVIVQSTFWYQLENEWKRCHLDGLDGNKDYYRLLLPRLAVERGFDTHYTKGILNSLVCGGRLTASSRAVS